ncbi:hypothetical protein ACTFIW_013126, partial [Dictyostelium discoideum]
MKKKNKIETYINYKYNINLKIVGDIDEVSGQFKGTILNIGPKNKNYYKPQTISASTTNNSNNCTNGSSSDHQHPVYTFSLLNFYNQPKSTTHNKYKSNNTVENHFNFGPKTLPGVNMVKHSVIYSIVKKLNKIFSIPAEKVLNLIFKEYSLNNI